MKKVGVIGLGLIGGSISLALKNRYKDEVYIYGYDLNDRSALKALSSGALDEILGSPSEVASKAELVIIATPMESVEPVLREISSVDLSTKVITDVCSLKSKVVEAAESLLPNPENFVGGHPMAGSEKGGFDAAHHEIFTGRPYIITPTDATSEFAIGEVHWLIRSIGARPVSLSPEEHDLAVAFNSHLTHVVSWAIVSLATKDRIADVAARFGGPSYREMTRVSMSSPSLWSQILSQNSSNVARAIEMLIKELNSFKEVVESGSRELIEEKIKPIREKRFEIYRTAEERAEIYRVEVVLPNRPGQLARVTSLLGKEGINIENIEMVHGEGQGLLFIDLSGQENALQALKVLKENGFEVSISGEG